MAVFGEALKNRQQVSFLIAGLVPRIRALASHSCDVPLRGRYDKQRFDGLINDLEFLISNIEAASPREPPLTITPLEMDSRTLTEEHKAEVKCRSTESSSTAPLDSMANQSVCKTSIATMAQRQPPQQTIIQASASTSVKAPSNTCIHREQGYTWSINEMRDSSAVFYGNVGGAQLAPAPAGQTVQFKVGTTTGHARVMGGAMNDRNFDTFFNATARDRK
ncbi:hypothetical protein PV05_09186 [Exophiala xenobiotica]|uniref:Uncharacterized protein n=1 Tax=Exophiala xenobiotica TaxID=348802 RepID=A0A0D2F0Y2_9EURO|nr:uncharacterized protein PV05_09186 [Exophiala xenobiotica]KIW53634.1 hypothetical protein PV05_09186 [Exophiala xenobiotica]